MSIGRQHQQAAPAAPAAVHSAGVRPGRAGTQPAHHGRYDRELLPLARCMTAPQGASHRTRWCIRHFNWGGRALPWRAAFASPRLSTALGVISGRDTCCSCRRVVLQLRACEARGSETLRRPVRDTA